jgi:hypothetical protein
MCAVRLKGRTLMCDGGRDWCTLADLLAGELVCAGRWLLSRMFVHAGEQVTDLLDPS